MIDKNSALYSIPLATLAANKGLVISPVQGTPLAELVKINNDLLNASCSVHSLEATDNDLLNDFVNNVSECTVSETENSHDNLMDAYIADISKAVSSHIGFAKNVVRPVIMEMVEEVQKSLGETILPSSLFKIEMSELPKPMQNAGFETSISKFSEKPFIAPVSQFYLDEISPQGILELMQTGSKEYDDCIKEWFVNKGDLFFMDIWNNLFRDFKEGKPSQAFNFTTALTVSVTNEIVDTALAIHLISRKLYDEVPDNTKLTLSQFRDLAAQYREASGIKLNQEYIRYANILKNKTLVATIDQDGKGCRVNGAVYRDWLKSGGSNEVLLGMLVGKQSLFTQSLINENKEQFLKDWNSFVLFSNTSEKNKSFNRFKDVLTLSFSKILCEMSDVEKESIAGMTAYTQKVNEIFNSELLKLKTSDVNDVFTVCLSLICKARFYYTDAEKILTGINDAVKANPSIDIREAALLSSIEYIVDYISDQLSITVG